MSKIHKALASIKNNSLFFRLLWFYWLRFRRQITYKIDDCEYIRKIYHKQFGVYPNLASPVTFNEKINWLKLNYRHKLMPRVADKFLVREYIEQLGYGKLLNRIIGIWNNVNDIDFNKMPSRFVLKATHASGTGWIFIVKNKNLIDIRGLKRVMKQWLQLKIDWMGREWHYAEMKPKIICEEYLEDESGELMDYKFHCFGGETKFCFVCIGRYGGHKITLCYNNSWEIVNYTKDTANLPESFTLPKPENYDKMIEIAQALSKPFPYVRVDFYNIRGRIVFGELTFYDGSGFSTTYTDKAQIEIGKMLNLPKANKDDKD